MFKNPDWPMVLPKVTMLCVILLIILTITSLFLFFREQMTTEVKTNIEKNPVAVKVPVSEIPSWHLFGTAETTNVTTMTNLPLTLLGIMLSTNSHASIAIISQSEEPEKAYHVGDSLPGNATLHQILPNEVIILRQGKYERLPLIKSDQKNGALSQAEQSTNEKTPQSRNEALMSRIQEWQRNIIKSSPLSDDQ